MNWNGADDVIKYATKNEFVKLLNKEETALINDLYIRKVKPATPAPFLKIFKRLSPYCKEMSGNVSPEERREIYATIFVLLGIESIPFCLDIDMNLIDFVAYPGSVGYVGIRGMCINTDLGNPMCVARLNK